MSSPLHYPFGTELVPARFIRRVNRFLLEAEVQGCLLPVHLHDPGRLREILLPGVELYLRPARGSDRKTAYTAVLARCDGVLVALDTVLPNRLLAQCLRAGVIHEFRDYALARAEVPFGRSRFDFHLTTAGIDILLEVKSVTLVRHGVALFPDAPTARGVRHLRELRAAARTGFCGTVLFLVQRADATVFQANAAIDPLFATTLAESFRQGIEVIAYTAELSLAGITLGRRLPVVFSPTAAPGPAAGSG